jgi:hypothetical protein
LKNDLRFMIAILRFVHNFVQAQTNPKRLP